jgi:hypothetical protein
VRSGLPLLAGMVVTFAIFATLAAVGGGWVVKANEYGRWLAIALIVLFGLTLLFPSLAERVTRPFVAVGNRMVNASDSSTRGTPTSSFVLACVEIPTPAHQYSAVSEILPLAGKTVQLAIG